MNVYQFEFMWTPFDDISWWVDKYPEKMRTVAVMADDLGTAIGVMRSCEDIKTDDSYTPNLEIIGVQRLVVDYVVTQHGDFYKC